MKILKLPKVPKLAARERLIAVISALVVTVTLLDRAVISPWWKHANQTRQDIKDLKQEVATNRRLLSRSAEVSAKIQVYHDYLRTARSPEVEMSELVREIERLAADGGVTLGTVTPLPTTENWPYQEHAMDVQYSGTLEQSVRFIYFIESSKKLFRLQRSSLVSEKRGSTGLLQGAIRLTSSAILGAKPLEGAVALRPQ